MKSRIYSVLFLVLALVLTFTSVFAADEPIKITLLTRSSYANDANVVRDLLVKQGFDVTLDIQPDYASFHAKEEAGNYDVAFTGWATISGNGDYATRGIFHSTGVYNGGGINDPELDALIDKAATVTYEESLPIYAEVEKKLIDNAYIAPLFTGRKVWAFNKDIVDPATVDVYCARPFPFDTLDFVDKSKRDTDTFYMWQAENYYTVADPARSNENSTYLTNGNQYVRLLTFDANMQVGTNGSLSYNYVVADGNQNFYFILRDDINFAKVEDMHAVDTGIKVGAEDVIFSLNRAKDPDAVPGNQAYSNFESIDTVVTVTDLAELESTKDSATGTSVLESLSAGLPAPISELVESKEDVDNAAGKYQVVKITTKTVFPQMANFIAHHTGGILCKEQVEAINTYEDPATYDPNKDMAYGDSSKLVEGPNYDNTIYASGPYIMLYMNDYEIAMEKNPGFMPGTDNEPKIKNVTIKMIPDPDSALSALRSGEIYMFDNVSPEKDAIINSEPSLELLVKPGVSFRYLNFNLKNPDRVVADVNVRRAILNSMDQDAFIAFNNGNVFYATSTLTSIMDTGYTYKPDPSLVPGFLEAYRASK